MRSQLFFSGLCSLTCEDDTIRVRIFSGVCLLGVKYGEYIIVVQRSVNFIARLIGADGLIKTS